MAVAQYEYVTATFRPKRLDTLRPRAVPAVGGTLRLLAAWVIDEEDGGPYVGQMAFLPEPPHDSIGWIPEEDLESIVVVGG